MVDNFLETNWYLPTLILTCTSTIIRNTKKAIKLYSDRRDTWYKEVKDHLPSPVHFLRGEKKLSDFVLRDIYNILQMEDENLRSCYKKYSRLSPVLEACRKYFETNPGRAPSRDLCDQFNDYLFDMVSFNAMCADMYFGISTILCVVGSQSSSTFFQNTSI